MAIKNNMESHERNLIPSMLVRVVRNVVKNFNSPSVSNRSNADFVTYLFINEPFFKLKLKEKRRKIASANERVVFKMLMIAETVTSDDDDYFQFLTDDASQWDFENILIRPFNFDREKD